MIQCCETPALHSGRDSRIILRSPTELSTVLLVVHQALTTPKLLDFLIRHHSAAELARAGRLFPARIKKQLQCERSALLFIVARSEFKARN
jgi:hypothetical protein